GRPLDVAMRKAINDALLRWKVVFFRGQHLDHRGHVAFARQMGEPTIGHAVFGHIEDFPEIYSVAKFRTAQTHRAARPQRPWTGWHTDITAALNPPKASILRGVTIPPYGGDTFWTNLAVAYQGLSETMRGIVDGLRGIHRFQAPTGTREESGVRRERPPPGVGDRASDRARASRDGRARPVRQSVIPEGDRRPHGPRERDDARSALGACHP